ncbi:MAG: ABC transporter permease subunit [Lachnospiraceae bacterium]|nr:ABC transporter permease subunit [Lachnospiraceae bacterium]
MNEIQDNKNQIVPAASHDTSGEKVPGKSVSFRTFWEKAVPILLALLIWQAASMLVSSSILLSSPLDVLLRLGTIWREEGFFRILLFTISHIAGGYLLALCSGILLAFLAARFSVIEMLLWPWVTCFRSVPVASMVVIFLIWVSSRNLSVLISFLVVFPVIYNNVLTGLKNVDRRMLELAQVFRLPAGRKLRYIVLPQIRPYLVSAASVTAGMAWKAGVAAEIIGTPPLSVGKMIYQSKIWLDTDDLFAWTLILVVLSVLFEKLFTALLKKLIP